MLTLEKMRADIAQILEITPEEVGLDDNLMDLGLDSMRVMTLAMAWEQEGTSLDFGMFAQYFTLGEWWRLVAAEAAN